MKNILSNIVLTIVVSVVIIGCLASCITAKKVEKIVAAEIAKGGYFKVSTEPFNPSKSLPGYFIGIPESIHYPVYTYPIDSISIGRDSSKFEILKFINNGKTFIDSSVSR